MTIKTQVIFTTVLVIMAFACGRISVQAPSIRTSIQTEVEKHDNKNTNKHEIVTITKKPDGTTTTTKVIDINTIDKTITNTTSDITQVITQPKTNILNVSVLAANDFSTRQFLPVYGVAISKEIIGPITAGAFGLSNGMIGLSIGLNF